MHYRFRRRDLISNWPTTFEFVGSGVSDPRIIRLYDRGGQFYKQLVKGGDDSRQDAVAQQLFVLLNECLDHPLRTYKVICLTPSDAVMEWVLGTLTFGAYVHGNDSMGGAHGVYHPADLKHQVIKQQMYNLGEKNKRKQIPNKDVVKFFVNLIQKFNPAFHYFFFENFKTPSSYLKALSNYQKSTAINSIVGHIVGIGDRHTNNILLSPETGECVHIDFGMIFEFAQYFLPVAEQVPFRFTRDIEAGVSLILGRDQGVFRNFLERTFEVLKKNEDLLMAVCEVFLYDPINRWSIMEDKGNTTSFRKNNLNLGGGNIHAEKTLLLVKEKINGIDSDGNKNPHVASLVQQLLGQAGNLNALALMYQGWGAWC